MPKPTVKQGKLTDFTPDPHNANKGTERGHRLLDDSLRTHGAGRSILADKNGVIIAGNKTTQAAADIGLDDAIIVQTDGKQVVVVQRTDIDINTPEGRALAYKDNKIAADDLAWSAEQIVSDLQMGLLPERLFDSSELEAIIALTTEPDWSSAFDGLPTGDRAPFQQMTFTLHDSQVEIVKRAIGLAKGADIQDSENANSNGNALATICQAYLAGAVVNG